jgi:hypothetical protein
VTKIIQEQRLLKLAADQGDTKAQTELAELNKRLPK